MNGKLTLRGTLTSLPIYFGIACIGYWLVHFFMRMFMARGGGVDIDAAAASTALSIKGIVAGVVILTIGLVSRWVFASRRHAAR
jgi:hypothetical protein